MTTPDGMHSRGEIPSQILDPFDSLDALAQRVAMHADLVEVWKLVRKQINGPILWATDPQLPFTGKKRFRLSRSTANAGRYLAPGNLTYPKPTPVPGMAVMVEAGGETSKVHRWSAPMMAYRQPIEISQAPNVQYATIDQVVGVDHDGEGLDFDEENPPQTVEGVLQTMNAQEAFVVPLGVFVPMAGNGQYETHFVPTAFAFEGGPGQPNYDFRAAIIQGRDLIGHKWAFRNEHRQYLEDIRDPKNPRLFQAVYTNFEEIQDPNSPSNQIIVITQAGSLPNRQPLRGGLDFYGGGPTESGEFATRATGGLLGRPKITQGKKTNTRTKRTELSLADTPAVVFVINVFGITPVDLPNVEPQNFSQWVGPYIGMLR